MNRPNVDSCITQALASLLRSTYTEDVPTEAECDRMRGHVATLKNCIEQYQARVGELEAGLRAVLASAAWKKAEALRSPPATGKHYCAQCAFNGYGRQYLVAGVCPNPECVFKTHPMMLDRAPKEG